MFGVAGFAKLADLRGSRRALAGFGVPAALVPPLGVLLPFAELAVAATLVPVPTARLGAVGALSLLLIFIFGIGVNLARGRTPDCHCFGQLASAPAGWTTLARNVVLGLVAAFVVWRGSDNAGLSAVAWFGNLTSAQRVLVVMGLIGVVILAAEGFVLLQMLRQQGRLLLRLDALEAHFKGAAPATDSALSQQPAAGLPIGTPAPSFRLNGLRGETLTLEALLAAGKPLLLFFTNPNCGPCQAMMSDIHRYQRQHAAALTIALISEGTSKENLAAGRDHGVSQILLQKEREVAEAYEAYGTPGAVVIRPDGTVGSHVAMGAEAVHALVSQASSMTESPAMSAAPRTVRPNGDNGNEETEVHVLSPTIGQPAPPLKLQDIHGRTINLQTFHGRETLLLFWNPGCGFCQQMLDELKAWDASPPPEAPKLVVVSTGTTDEILEMNLRATVLLDPDFLVAPAFGAGGTPMAILIDAKGRIASDVVAGAKAVLALAGVTPREGSKPH